MRASLELRLVKPEISRFPRKERAHMPGSVTTPGLMGACECAPISVAFHLWDGVGTRDQRFYRGSMAGLCVPLSTLRSAPHGTPRMTWGQHDSLDLYCEGLSPFTPCRSPGALAYDFLCAVQRHGLPAGANPARQLSLQPVAIEAVVEVTKRLKPSM